MALPKTKDKLAERILDKEDVLRMIHRDPGPLAPQTLHANRKKWPVFNRLHFQALGGSLLKSLEPCWAWVRPAATFLSTARMRLGFSGGSPRRESASALAIRTICPSLRGADFMRFTDVPPPATC